MRATLRVLRPHLGGQRRILVVAGISTVLVALAEVAKPFPLKLVIDRLLGADGSARVLDLGADDLLLLAGVAAMVLTIAGVEALAAYHLEMRLRAAGEGVAHSLRVAVYAHLQRLSLSYHDGTHHGDVVTRATGDVHAVGQLVSETTAAIAASALLLIGMAIISLVIDPVLALAAFSVAPLLGVLLFVTRTRVTAAARHQRSTEGEIASLATETLSAMRAVKSLGSEEFEGERLERASLERRSAGVESARIEGRLAGAVDILGALGAAVVLVVGVVRVAAGAVSPGDLVVMVSYARRIHRPLRELARETGRLARGLARAERVAEILASDEILPEPTNAYRSGRARGQVRLESVSFSYTSDQPVLADISLDLPAGRKLVLAGASGAGKSTVAALIARFYDPTSGRITLDGRDLKACSVPWLRSQIGLVLQDTILFTGNVADNIAYGTHAGPDDVVRAARAAGAHDFVVGLPDGYDTTLGPRGMALSGGQRQRIALARTLLRDPPVLVLDEPTAALDEEAEAEVIEGLAALLAGRTALIITHSPALTSLADEVVTLARGRIRTLAPAPHPTRGIREAVRPWPSISRAPPRAVPADAALPHIGAVLDPDLMADVFGGALDDGAHRVEAHVSYLRYKPGTNLVVRFGVLVDGSRHDATAMIASGDYLERRASKPEHLALAALAGDRTPSRRPLSYDRRVGCLIQWYPLDLALPALAEPPDRLRRRLRAVATSLAVDGHAPILLAYKPRRRAVLRIGHAVVKAYAGDPDFAAACAGLQASQALSTIRVATFEGAITPMRLTIQSAVVGETVPAVDGAAPAAGIVLGALHATNAGVPPLRGLPVASPDRQLAAAAQSARLVATIVPGLRNRVDRLVDDLGASVPTVARLVPSHGDFNARQLIVANGGLVLTDFDELCLAPPALDVATYVAYAVRGDPGPPIEAHAVLAALLEGYGSRPPALSWYLATMILRRAPRPFRYFEPGWPARVEAMVDAAEAARQW